MTDIAFGNCSLQRSCVENVKMGMDRGRGKTLCVSRFRFPRYETRPRYSAGRGLPRPLQTRHNTLRAEGSRIKLQMQQIPVLDLWSNVVREVSSIERSILRKSKVQYSVMCLASYTRYFYVHGPRPAHMQRKVGGYALCGSSLPMPMTRTTCRRCRVEFSFPRSKCRSAAASAHESVQQAIADSTAIRS